MMNLPIPIIILFLLTASAGMMMGEKEGHWAFQPLREPTPPANLPDNWSINRIDPFILAALVDAGLRPSPQADPATLLRRLSLNNSTQKQNLSQPALFFDPKTFPENAASNLVFFVV